MTTIHVGDIDAKSDVNSTLQTYNEAGSDECMKVKFGDKPQTDTLFQQQVTDISGNVNDVKNVKFNKTDFDQEEPGVDSQKSNAAEPGPSVQASLEKLSLPNNIYCVETKGQTSQAEKGSSPLQSIASGSVDNIDDNVKSKSSLWQIAKSLSQKVGTKLTSLREKSKHGQPNSDEILSDVHFQMKNSDSRLLTEDLGTDYYVFNDKTADGNEPCHAANAQRIIKATDGQHQTECLLSTVAEQHTNSAGSYQNTCKIDTTKISAKKPPQKETDILTATEVSFHGRTSSQTSTAEDLGTKSAANVCDVLCTVTEDDSVNCDLCDNKTLSTEKLLQQKTVSNNSNERTETHLSSGPNPSTPVTRIQPPPFEETSSDDWMMPKITGSNESHIKQNRLDQHQDQTSGIQVYEGISHAWLAVHGHVKGLWQIHILLLQKSIEIFA